jgi:exodeoxyribonuclease V beta subunit
MSASGRIETEVSDLALALPLHGVQLIEASAGTGKTHTLAGIYTRLIVERRLGVRQILVVTFTKAATEELKSRLRARLLLCAEVAAGLPAFAAAPSPDLIQSRTLVAAALRDETAPALQARLRLAALELDSAQISTIHGFCQRALREHAFFAAAAADGELVATDRDLIQTIAEDLWRERAVAADGEAFSALCAVVGNVEQFARLLPRLLDARERLLPQPAWSEQQARAAIAAAARSGALLAQVWAEHGERAFAALIAHAHAGNINARSYALEKIQADAAIFARVFASGRTPQPALLSRYTTTALAAKGNKNKAPLPRQVFFNAIANALMSPEQTHAAQHELGLHVLHASIASARARLEAIKRAARRFSYDDLIRHLYDALSGPQADDLADALRQQYPCALVDEFQDTDAQQFAIFAAIYRDRAGHGLDALSANDSSTHALFLIGDPKQAIYRFRGGDIHTYLAARARADGVHALITNFRSTPGYLRALEYLYTFAGRAAFADARIGFEPVAPGGGVADDDLLIDGRPATPLTFWLAPDGDEAISKSDATAALAHGCAAAILDLLTRARNGQAQLRDARADGQSDYRALEPRDLAVLVNEHKEAAAMQAALSALGLPHVCVSKRSVFATIEARELHLVLDALVEFDEGRLRAALSSMLFAYSLADFAALATQPERWRDLLALFAELRQTWLAHGVLAMLERLFERRAAGLLALQGGERRMTNWLQLADLAQAASAQVFGLRGLTDWLGVRIAHADDENEDEQLRLEADADRVQVRTIHASKGLEYPVVFLPFAALRRGESNTYPKLLRFHSQDDGTTPGSAAAFLISDKEAAEQSAARSAGTAENAEDLAERLRLLYVGLTRARCACFVAAGVFGKNGMAPALLHLLAVDDEQSAARVLPQRLGALSARAGTSNGREFIALAPLPEHSSGHWRSPAQATLGPARKATRRLRELRGLYSFSRLSAGAHAETAAGDERAGIDDEPSSAGAPATLATMDLPAALRGARFGIAFHEILEKVDFSAWRDWRGAAAPARQQELLERVLLRHALIDAHGSSLIRQAVTQLVAMTLNAPLPLGACLAELAPAQRRAELPFHFAIEGADPAQWLQRMQAHGYLPERTRFALDAPRLAGLMTGVLDLVVFHHGRWWVIDYKTNVLDAGARGGLDESNPYAPTRLAQAVRAGEYDLQYLIYLVALHRWLKTRLGSHYDYARDVGGALYLFVRGLDGGGVNGIHRDCPPAALIEALDAMLAAPSEIAA